MSSLLPVPPFETYFSHYMNSEIYEKALESLQTPGINIKKIDILFDWIRVVSKKEKLWDETYFLFVSVFYRFIVTQKSVGVVYTKLQLVGVSCLYIAMKFHEICYISSEDLAYYTDGACTSTDIVEYEMIILKSLGYNLCYPTIYNFLSIFPISSELLEMSVNSGYDIISKPELLVSKPSIIASSIVIIAPVNKVIELI